ncbi:MAG: Holliday junction resolvase RuvX [Holosporales bacterium]|jgi:putative Holliday junction resolvase|nr:Holliday junction resolvase RuvX [Holosporales bacterium]
MEVAIIDDIRTSGCIGKTRALCIDYGDKRIGIAVSDIGWQIASPLKVINSHGCFPAIMDFVNEYAVGVIVIGIPYALNGGAAGQQREKVEKFIDKLRSILALEMPDKENASIKIIVWDERYSSVDANKLLDEACMSKRSRRSRIDKVAASLILQGMVDALHARS